jgi:hypothetical protein
MSSIKVKPATVDRTGFARDLDMVLVFTLTTVLQGFADRSIENADERVPTVAGKRQAGRRSAKIASGLHPVALIELLVAPDGIDDLVLGSLNGLWVFLRLKSSGS